MTERLARTCAAHPRRTLAFWGLAVVVSLVLVATVTKGRLTTNGYVIGSPQSKTAQHTIERVFPHSAYQAKHDVVVISSNRYAVSAPQFQAFGLALAHRLEATQRVSDIKLVGFSPMNTDVRNAAASHPRGERIGRLMAAVAGTARPMPPHQRRFLGSLKRGRSNEAGFRRWLLGGADNRFDSHGKRRLSSSADG